MFERRLKIVLALPVICCLIIVWRLYNIQIVDGAKYVEKERDSLLAPKQFLPPLRGNIRDRFGQVLVSDEPAHDVTVHYGALSLSEPFLLKVAAILKQQDPTLAGLHARELEREVRGRIAAMWLTLEKVSGIPMAELRSRRDAICRSVEDLRMHIWRRRKDMGFDEPLEKLRLREEDQSHPIIRDVSPQVRTRIELEISHLPLVRIEPSVRRVWRPEARSLCHVLGRLGQVSSELIKSDPQGDDWLACYRPGDLVGTAGVERLGEAMLRGKRGFEERFLGESIHETSPPIDGLDVQLSVDLQLQQRVSEILVDTVAAQTPATGASCVILDVASREILALVSVPGFDPEELATNYAKLRDDSRHVPLRFRAVGEEYQPGSIIKPVSLLAAFSWDILSPQSRVFCDGAFIPGSSKWHCWTHWRGMAGHGDMTAETAIQHSCNVYFYNLGQKLQAARLTDFYRQFVRGEIGDATSDHGTGLIEERDGNIPTADWIRRHRKGGAFSIADGRNYAIGQGEIMVTPLQAANIFATLAAGAYRDPTLIANDGRERPELPIPRINREDWEVVRRGLYRCVNEDGGTAYKHVHMSQLAICGKTGSAQCVPRVSKRRYTFELPGGEDVVVVAPTVEAAREALNIDPGIKPKRREIAETWPPKDAGKDEVPTHAWFTGYAPADNPRIALAIIIEYGGGGGATAGPAAKAVFEELMASPRGYLTADFTREQMSARR
ncbi:MAG: hypothetical protein AMXMBFR20_12280 [Planctomycetia bacterium]